MTKPRPWAMSTRNCDHCRRLYEAGPRQGQRRYCSPDCQEEARYASRRRWQAKLAARRAQARLERFPDPEREARRQRIVQAYATMPVAIAAPRFGLSVTTFRRELRAAGIKLTWEHKRCARTPARQAA